MHIFLE